MYAGEPTRAFKTLVIEWLEASGLGFDTRYRHYRSRFPALGSRELARLVCDPIERYDPDWPSYRSCCGLPEEEALVRFVAERDAAFRDAARAAIYCFDEAGLGSGINTMRFVLARKPLFGFYSSDPRRRRVNLTNVLQLAFEFPDRVKLCAYRAPEEVTARLAAWLRELDAAGGPAAAR